MYARRDEYWARYAQALEEGVPEQLARVGVTRGQIHKVCWSTLGLCAVAAALITVAGV